MWDKKDQKDAPPGGYTTGTGYASQPSYSAPSRLVNIGQTIFIKGELTGTEDLTIEGRVEGKIELKDHNLTIGPNGKIKADVYAKNIVITGEVLGSAFASEKVELTSTGVLKGDIVAPRILIADGAQFKGSVDMEKGNSLGRTGQASRPEQAKPLAAVSGDTAARTTQPGAPSAPSAPFEKR